MTSAGASGEPTQVVQSPEQVTLHFPVAGPTSRMLAYGIDLFVIGLLMLALFVLVVLVGAATDAFSGIGQRIFPEEVDPSDQQQVGRALLIFVAVLIVVQIVVEWGYFVFFEMAMGGRSIGKRVLGLRVMRDGGLPLTLRESLLRNLMRAVDMLPSQYLVGLVAMVMSDEGKRLGDMVAGTIVVRTDAVPAPRPLPTRNADEPSTFRFERAQLERVGAAESMLIRQALRRADEFGGEQATATLARAVQVLCEKLAHEHVPPAEQRAFLIALLDAIRAR